MVPMALPGRCKARIGPRGGSKSNIPPPSIGALFGISPEGYSGRPFYCAGSVCVVFLWIIQVILTYSSILEPWDWLRVV